MPLSLPQWDRLSDSVACRLVELEDRARYSPGVRSAVGRVRWYLRKKGEPVSSQERVRRAHALCSVVRYTRHASTRERAQQEIFQLLDGVDSYQVDWREFAKGVEQRRVAKAAILKPRQGNNEPGIIHIAFERCWFQLIHHLSSEHLDRLTDEYTIVVAPSSNPHNVLNYMFPRVIRKAVFSLINHATDVEVISTLAPNYYPIPLYTSHWGNPSLFHPRPRMERHIDLIMVASFGKVKRHHVLFKAMQSMPSINVWIIGQDQDGRNVNTIREMARRYGVESRLTLLANASYETVVDALGRSKACVLLSLNEGSSVIVSEALFSDTPMAIFENASNGSRAFINSQTGMLIHEEELPAQLQSLIALGSTISPRRWAEQNISCFQSTNVLNRFLKDAALNAGQDWTTDIATVCWRPNIALVDVKDARRMWIDWNRIRDTFGLEIGEKPEHP